MTNHEHQTCKSFIVRSILPSTGRTAALAKYLLILSKSCAPREPGSRVDTTKGGDEFEGLGKIVSGKEQQPPASASRRLHVLYIVHDVLAFATLRLQKDPGHARAYRLDPAAVETLQNAVPTIAQLAVCSDGNPSSAGQTSNAVKALLEVWERHSILPGPMTSKLHESIKHASSLDLSSLVSQLAAEEAQAALCAQRAREEASKWTLPSTHRLPHDTSTPWYDMPAANGMCQRRIHGYPLRVSGLPGGGFSLRDSGLKADEESRRDVEDLLGEAKRCFDRWTEASEVEDVDALGSMIWKAGTGRKRRNYWGWSYEGIEERKRRAQAEQY